MLPMRAFSLRWLVLLLSALIGAAHGAAVIDVEIDLREEIAAGRFVPGRDGVGLRGAAPLLSWGRTLPAQPGPEPGRYILKLQVPTLPAAGQPLAYKFKIDSPGRPDDGWESGPNRGLLLQAGVQRLARAFGSGVDIPVQRTGDIETLPAIASAHVSAREVQVWLPPGYRDAIERRYPVLYLHDGQNLFDARAAGAEWQLDEHAQRGVLDGSLQPMIIVAVASNGDRMADYTPSAQPRPEGGTVGGGAAAYARYLVQELKPAIDRRYRTRPGREHTAVGGSSLGGLVSMWLLLAQADSFGAALVVSPSVWWADGDILARVAAAAPALPAPRIWLDVGAREGEGMLGGARRLRDALQARGWAPAYLEAPAGGHDEASWALRVPAMLSFLYGRPRPLP